MQVKLIGEGPLELYNGDLIEEGQIYEVDVVDEFLMDEITDLIKAGTLEREWAPTDLVLFQLIGEQSNYQQIDFSLLGLRKESPSYSLGRKTEASYFHGEQLCVRKVFEDVNVDGNLTGLEIIFEYYNNDGSVGSAKRETAVTYNKYQAQTVIRNRRQRIIDYLVAGAKDTPIEVYIDQIFDKYFDEVQRFVAKGTAEFRIALENEEDPTLSFILGLDVTPLVPGWTVLASILEQIQPAEIEY